MARLSGLSKPGLPGRDNARRFTLEENEGGWRLNIAALSFCEKPTEVYSQRSHIHTDASSSV